MKNKKIIFLIVVILVLIAICVFFIVKNSKSEPITETEDITEYTPEEEISSKQMRETIVTLYFLNTESNELKSEGKLIDSSLLLNNPYEQIINLLLQGPQASNLTSVFPENTKLLDANLNNGCVTLNFSEQLLNYSDDTQKYNIINCLLNTLTQLNEVNSFKILINGELASNFNEEYFESN